MYCMLIKCQSSVDEVSIKMLIECQSRCRLRVDQGHGSKHAFRTHNLNSLYCLPYICHRIMWEKVFWLLILVLIPFIPAQRGNELEHEEVPPNSCILSELFSGIFMQHVFVC